MRSRNGEDPGPASFRRRLRVLIADEREEALEELGRVLESLGHEVMPYAVSVRQVAELVARDEPDVACVMLHEDDEHALALISEVVELRAGPVVAVLRSNDVELVARVADQGVAAYITSQEPDAVESAIEIALRRHHESADLAEKVGQLQTALDRRAIIERAKGMLMERHGVDERSAFSLLRDHARANQRRVVDVAAGVAAGDRLPLRGP